MIEGYLPGLVRVDPVGVAPAEVVAQALRCELLEAALTRYGVHEFECPARWLPDGACDCGLAALVAAGATGKAGT